MPSTGLRVAKASARSLTALPEARSGALRTGGRCGRRSGVDAVRRQGSVRDVGLHAADHPALLLDLCQVGELRLQLVELLAQLGQALLGSLDLDHLLLLELLRRRLGGRVGLGDCDFLCRRTGAQETCGEDEQSQ